jgi:hypothetical protein
LTAPCALLCADASLGLPRLERGWCETRRCKGDAELCREVAPRALRWMCEGIWQGSLRCCFARQELSCLAEATAETAAETMAVRSGCR